MELIINQIATCGCEILKDNQVVAWSVDRAWAEIVKKALES
jgi:hypothetical protein